MCTSSNATRLHLGQKRFKDASSKGSLTERVELWDREGWCQLDDYSRYAGVAGVLLFPKPVLLDEEIEALRFFPHVVEGHTLGHCPCFHLGGNTIGQDGKKNMFPSKPHQPLFPYGNFIRRLPILHSSPYASVWGESFSRTGAARVQSFCILLRTTGTFVLQWQKMKM